jgi:hypothetical protein
MTIALLLPRPRLTGPSLPLFLATKLLELVINNVEYQNKGTPDIVSTVFGQFDWRIPKYILNRNISIIPTLRNYAR